MGISAGAESMEVNGGFMESIILYKSTVL